MKITVIRGKCVLSVLSGLLLFLYTVNVFLFPLTKNTAPSAAVPVTSAPTSFVFVIDAGHGGTDGGANFGGTKEKDLNLSIALTLGEILSGNGHNVVYTRTDDVLLCSEEDKKAGLGKINDLKNRVKFTKEQKNPVFISIHQNSFGDSRYSGLQVFYSENNEESRILAQSIQKSVHDKIQNGNERTVRPGKDIYVLENQTCPSVLIECGFMSNPEELSELCKKEYQKQLSFAIYCGIIEYMK